ncbi:MAG: hypothetical protein ACPL0B_01655 [Anaerolineales bacterium]
MGEKRSVILTSAFVAEAIILFILGLGVAHYLGYSLEWEPFFLALGWTILLQLSGIFLLQATPPPLNLSKNHTSNEGFSNSKLSQSLLLAIALLASLASLTVLFIAKGYISSQILFIMFSGVVGMMFLSLSPFKETLHGFHEVLLSILMTFFIPLFGFESQSQDIHRLILMIALPLFSLRMSATLTYELSTYTNDIKKLNPTLLIRIGWQNGMFLHDALILFSFLLIALAVIFGLPLPIALPSMSALILGLLQIWNMRKIAEGKKPNWRAMIIGDFSLYLLVIYFLAYSFWVR